VSGVLNCFCFYVVADVSMVSMVNSVTVTRCCSYSCFVLLKMGDNDTRNM